MNRIPNVIVACLALFTVILSTAAVGQDAVNVEKEMQVLAKLLGTWDTKYKAAIDRPPTESTHESILDGRYIQRTGSANSADMKILELMTYDPGENCYRIWTHFSKAFLVIEHRGTWDEKTQTMTWQAKFKSGATRTTTIGFESESIMKWTISGRDANGDVRNGPTEVLATLRKMKD